jgi:hypothetical protein
MRRPPDRSGAPATRAPGRTLPGRSQATRLVSNSPAWGPALVPSRPRRAATISACSRGDVELELDPDRERPRAEGDAIAHRAQGVDVAAVGREDEGPLEAVASERGEQIVEELLEGLGGETQSAREVEVLVGATERDRRQRDRVGDPLGQRAPRGASAIQRSVASGRWGPCCSIEPRGTIAVRRPAAIARSTSGQLDASSRTDAGSMRGGRGLGRDASAGPAA